MSATRQTKQQREDDARLERAAMRSLRRGGRCASPGRPGKPGRCQNPDGHGLFGDFCAECAAYHEDLHKRLWPESDDNERAA